MILGDVHRYIDLYWSSGHAGWTDQYNSKGFWLLIFSNKIAVIEVRTTDYTLKSGNLSDFPSVLYLSVADSILSVGITAAGETSYDNSIIVAKL